MSYNINNFFSHDPDLYNYLITRSWFDSACQENLEQLIDSCPAESYDDFFAGAMSNIFSGAFPQYVKKFLEGM